MDQVKIGRFLKELRSARGLTQEQAAEQLHVSARTVSRWETGSNMPDIATLVELAEFFDVSIPEIIDGERKSEKMDPKEKERLLMVADYSESERSLLMQRVLLISSLGLIALLIGFVLLFVSFGMESTGPLHKCMEGTCFGFAGGALITCILFASGVLSGIRNSGGARRLAHIVGVVSAIVTVACIAVCLMLTIHNQQ